jgi:hypothetical protein
MVYIVGFTNIRTPPKFYTSYSVIAIVIIKIDQFT